MGSRPKAYLGHQARLLLAMNAQFLLAIALSNAFVNVYMWKIKSDYAMIGVYNLATYFTMAVVFYLGGILVKNVDRALSIRLGVAVMAAFFFTVLFLGKQSVDFILLLGILLGTGQGLYWLGYSVMYFEITSPDNRDNYNGVNGFLTSGAGMIAPIVAGWIISSMKDLLGYKVIFSASLAIFVSAVVTSFFIINRRAKGEFDLGTVWRDTVARSRWHWALLAITFQGVREGVNTFLIGLLVYVVTTNELTLGTYMFAVSAMSLVAFYVTGKWMRPERREKAILFGAVMMGLSAVPLFSGVNLLTLYILGIGGALFYPLYGVAITSTTFDIIGESKNKAEHRVEYIVFREWALNVGRISSLLVFIGVVMNTESFAALTWIIVAINAAQIFSWVFLRRVYGTLRKSMV